MVLLIYATLICMGSYWSFSVDGYQLLSSKSYVDSVVMTMFTEAEKSIREVLQSESYQIIVLPPQVISFLRPFHSEFPSLGNCLVDGSR